MAYAGAMWILLLSMLLLITLCGCSHHAAQYSAQRQSSAAQFTSLKRYKDIHRIAEEMSAVSKRREHVALPVDWNGMVALAKDEMEAHQWAESQIHLTMAIPMAPNASALVLTKSLLATLAAKQGHYEQAQAMMDQLLASPEARADANLTSALQTMRATMKQFEIAGRVMP